MATVTQEVNPQDEAAWYNVIGKLKAKAAEFNQVYNRLVSQRPIAAKSPALTTEYNKWFDRAFDIKVGLEKYETVVDQVLRFFKLDWLFSGLGGPWLIGASIAGAATFVATMTVVVRDGWIFSRKLDFVASQTEKGVPLTDAVDNANRMAGGRSAPWIQIDTKYLALGAGALGGLWLFLKMRSP